MYVLNLGVKALYKYLVSVGPVVEPAEQPAADLGRQVAERLVREQEVLHVRRVDDRVLLHQVADQLLRGGLGERNVKDKKDDTRSIDFSGVAWGKKYKGNIR